MILFRYISREIFSNMAAVTLTLLVIVMSGRFVKYLSEAASGDLAPDVLFSIMLFRLPGFLELVLPLGLFIAILLAFGRLYVDSEMTVMSACGLSTGRLALYTLFPAVVTAAMVALMSLYAGPEGLQRVQQIFAEAKNRSGLDLLVAGRFRVDKANGRVVYIESMDRQSQTLQQVFSAEQVGGSGLAEASLIVAETGRVVTDADNGARYLVLQDGRHYELVPGQLAMQTTRFEQFGQQLKPAATPLVSNKKVDARTTLSLLRSDTLNDRAALQWRLSLIVLVPIIALIALAMSRTNPRRGRYVQMLPAFLLYIAYLVLLNTAREAIEDEKLPVQTGFWLVHLLFAVIAALLLYASSWWRILRNKLS